MTNDGMARVALAQVIARLRTEVSTGMKFRQSTLAAVQKHYGVKSRTKKAALAELEAMFVERYGYAFGAKPQKGRIKLDTGPAYGDINNPKPWPMFITENGDIQDVDGDPWMGQDLKLIGFTPAREDGDPDEGLVLHEDWRKNLDRANGMWLVIADSDGLFSMPTPVYGSFPWKELSDADA